MEQHRHVAGPTSARCPPAGGPGLARVASSTTKRSREDDRDVQPTFAILPRCVPGQAEEGREENNRSGHSSISEPHLISAMPLLGWTIGDPGAALASLPPALSAFRVLTRA